MNKKVKASLTVYLSLILPLLISLTLALFYGARIHAEKMKVEIITDISGNSALGEYNKELLSQYGILMIDTAYNFGDPDINNLNNRIEYYAKTNADGNDVNNIASFLLSAYNYSKLSFSKSEVTEYTLATDNDAAPLDRQIFEYMEAEPIEGLLKDKDAEISEGKSESDANGGETADTSVFSEVAEKYSEMQGDIDNHRKEKAESNEEDDTKGKNASDLKEDADRQQKEDAMQNMADGDEESNGFTVLSLVMDTSKVSKESFDAGEVYTGRDDIKTGTGLNESNHVNIGEQLLFNEYIFEKFGYYGNEKDNAKLSYEIEYLIANKTTDQKNLASIALRIFLMRFVMDCVYMLNPSTPQHKEAKAIAAGILMIIPGLGETLLPAMEKIIQLIWAFVEARNDVAILMDGGKVPMAKSESTWNTSIENALSGKSGKSETGLSYGAYLRIILTGKQALGRNKVLKRMIDVMELDIRKSGYDKFKMDGCVDCFKTTIDFKGSSGHSYTFTRYFGYEEAAG